MLQKPKLNVLFLARWYPSAARPMPGLFVEAHARAVASLGYQVTVIHVEPVGRQVQAIAIQASEEHGMQVVRALYRNPRLLPMKYFRYCLATYKAWQKAVSISGDFDIVHVNILTRTAWLARFIRKARGTPYIISEHWSRYHNISPQNAFKGFLRKWYARRVVRGAFAVCPVSAHLMSAMQGHGLHNPRYVVVPNVVDTGRFVQGGQPVATKTFRLLHVSTFVEAAKNVKGMLRVFRAILASGKVATFDLVGGNNDLEEAKQYAKGLGLTGESVRFHGIVTGQALVDLYRQSHCLVLFSNFENQPCVIGEAFACGKPVIATRVGGIPEHVDEEKGLLVNPQDEKGLEDAVTSMMANYSSYSPDILRKYAVDHFSISAVAGAFGRLYEEAVKK
jgi:glycosyltransferase involved in cell wall biosynthesis